MLTTNVIAGRDIGRLAGSLRRNARGATMIEVLVAILLLTFALLGIAGLISTSGKYQLATETRGRTAVIFNDLHARLRANPWEMPGFDTTNTSPAYTYSQSWTNQQSTITAVTSCATTATADCSRQQRAQFDLWELRTLARQTLPQGSLILGGDVNNGITLTVMWMDKDFVAGTPPALQTSTTCSSTSTTTQRLSCCPSAASVGGTGTEGVRCANFTFIP